MPALYLSHGAPPLFDDARWMRQLSGWAQQLPKPTSILIVSAHWESAPLSLSASAANLLDLGRRLRSLRDEGVLVVGSGFMTHGLPFVTRQMLTHNTPPAWSADFDGWVADALARGDVDTLAAYRSKAPGMPYAHPTVEHYTPLFITVGAAALADLPVRTTIDGYMMGLSKRSFQVA